MKTAPLTEMEQALDWCASVLGQIEVMADHSKVHGGHESSTRRLRTSSGFCYLKVHQSQSHWHNEVYAYERWAGAFGRFAPRLLAVRDQSPLALVVGELPGQIVENASLSPSQQHAVWRAAGAALVALHDLGPGEHFGSCRRDGTYAEAFAQDARLYVSGRFKGEIERAIQGEYANADELATLQAACALIPAFEGEHPTPCHRDYCAANWLVDETGDWIGAIDWEFAHWDVRVADFSRDPNWAWLRRPDLVDAFFEGYGRSLTPAEEQQILVAHAEYALGALLWGRDHAFYGFEQEGREALSRLAALLK
ncbi:MAG: aminoglycoside phosphotransferase family protein [Anaerolineae bacterium]|nr:aminoglycoside phosphotransferase family protein [Anaerolineae bacterium]